MQVERTCGSCGEPFTYERPAGTPGRMRVRCNQCIVDHVPVGAYLVHKPIEFVREPPPEIVAPQPKPKPAPVPQNVIPDEVFEADPYDPDEPFEVSLDRMVVGPLGRTYRESMKRIGADGHPDSVLLLNVARRIDRGFEGGSAHAALVRECRAIANNVFAGSAHAPDVLDELQARRRDRAERVG